MNELCNNPKDSLTIEALLKLILTMSESTETKSLSIRFKMLLDYEVIFSVLKKIKGVGLLTLNHNTLDAETKIIVGTSSCYDVKDFGLEHLKHVAAENKCSLVYLLNPEDSDPKGLMDVRVIGCTNERAMTVGDLIDGLERLKTPDCIPVYEHEQGLVFAACISDGLQIKLDRLTLQSEMHKAITVHEFVEFLKEFPATAQVLVLSPGCSVVNHIEYYKNNVVTIAIETLDELVEYYTNVLKIAN